MLKLDPAVTPIGMAGLLAVAIGIGAGNFAAQSGVRPEQIASPAFADTSAAPQWAASATGRVEPVNGEIRIAGQVPGKIVEVLAKTNDKVEAGDLLARLDDQEIYAKIAAASAETGVRERERQDEPPTGLAKERQDAEDAVANAERRLSSAREMFDAALRAVHASAGSPAGAGSPASAGSPEKFADGRKSVQTAKAELEAARVALAAVRAKPEMPLETRLESSLAMARAELSAAEIALERTRIRAPASGTILNMIGKEGETAVPSPESALLIFGDLSSLRLRAEVEERDAAKVRVGQKVVIRADAFPDREFAGVVTSISQSLGTPRIATRGPRRPNDVEVVEVMVSIDGNPPLFTGMRVDAFFKPETSATAAPAAKTN